MNGLEKEAVLYCLKSMIDEEVCEECPLYGTTGTDHCEKDCVRLAINALEQEPKTGHWIKAYWTTRLICSRCNKLNHSKWKPYCYECGSKNTEIVKKQKYGAESEG